MEKLWANPAVKSHTFGDQFDVGSHLFTEVRDLVNKGYLRCKKCIACIFDQLGRFDIGYHKRCFNKIQRPVEVLQDGYRLLAICAKHHSVGPHEVFNGRPLSEEFGVRYDIEIDCLFVERFREVPGDNLP